MLIKSYDNFVNEGKVGNFFRNIMTKIIDFFVNKFGDAGHFMAGVYATKHDLFRKNGIKGIAFYDYSDKSSNINVDLSETEETTNEAIIPLKHPHPGVMNVDPDELAKEIVRCYKLRRPILIWGAPGVGKSDIFRQTAEKMKLRLIDMRLSDREPTDFLGMPSVDKEKHVTYYNIPEMFPRETPGDPGGILFFDEINAANDLVLKASLQLILDRKLQNYELPKNWVIMAAANRPDTGEATNLTPLSPPLLNRFLHVNLFTTVEHWIKWARKQSNISDEIIGFIMWRPDYLHCYDPDDEDVSFPSPRTWQFAAERLNAVEEEAKEERRRPTEDEIERAMAPAIGNAIAKLFVRYHKLVNAVDVRELHKVYTDPKNAPLPPANNIDVTHAMMLSIALVKKDEKINLDNLYNVMAYADRIKEKEMVSPLLHYVVSYHPEVKEDPKYHHEFLTEWYKRFPKNAGFHERSSELRAKEEAEKAKKKK